MYMCEHACGGPVLMAETILDRSSTLFFEAESLSQTQSWLMWFVLQASVL